MTIGEVAGVSAVAAIAAFILAAISIALFFGGAGSFWGPVNDVFAAVTVLLLIPVMVAVLRLAPDDIGPWFAIVSWAAVLGALVIAVVQVLLVVGVVSLATSFTVGGIGVVPILVWAVGLAYLVLARDMLPVEVGWLLAATLVIAGLLTVSSMVAPWPVTGVIGVLFVVAFVGWLAQLSSELRAAV
jgi:hypothetical protein